VGVSGDRIVGVEDGSVIGISVSRIVGFEFGSDVKGADVNTEVRSRVGRLVGVLDRKEVGSEVDISFGAAVGLQGNVLIGAVV
jgi:hypothetical protein